MKNYIFNRKPVFLALLCLAGITSLFLANNNISAKSRTRKRGSKKEVYFKPGPKGSRLRHRIRPVKLDKKNGFEGWKIKLSNETLSMPSTNNGLVYVSGGLGSKNIYALDAKTGKSVWAYKAGDGGPSDAVVDEDHFSYNTQSCTLYVHDSANGRLKWRKWLGSTLYSQPAMDNGRLFASYPDKNSQYHLVAFDVKNGDFLWNRKTSGEALTAPIIHKDSVYMSTTTGVLYRFRATDGKMLWSKKCNASSAPYISDGKVYFSQRENVIGNENLQAKIDVYNNLIYVKNIRKDAKEPKKMMAEIRKSLSEGYNIVDANTGVIAFKKPMNPVLSFPSKAKNKWHSYLDTRPLIINDVCYRVVGNKLSAVESDTGKFIWETDLRSEAQQKVKANGDIPTLFSAPIAAQPAYASGKLFIATTDGRLLCIYPEVGVAHWKVETGMKLVSQPVITEERLFLTTSTGTLICIKIEDPIDGEWTMWGGGTKHNGPANGDENRK